MTRRQEATCGLALRPGLARRPRQCGGSWLGAGQQELFTCGFEVRESAGQETLKGLNSAQEKAELVPSFLEPRWADACGQSFSATFTKSPSPWCDSHKRILSVCGTLKLFFEAN